MTQKRIRNKHYCANNALKSVDPTGLWVWWDPKTWPIFRRPKPPVKPNPPPLAEVAVQALLIVVGSAGVEHGSHVITSPGGGFSAIQTGVGDGTGMNLVPALPGLVGSWHTHPAGSGHGSDFGDQYLADVTGRIGYAGDSNGDIIINPPRPGHGDDAPPANPHDNYNDPAWGTKSILKWK